MTKFLAFLAIIAAAIPVASWLFMIIIGVIHAEWIPACPTIGYGWAVALGALFAARALVGSIAGACAKKVTGTR